MTKFSLCASLYIFFACAANAQTSIVDIYTAADAQLSNITKSKGIK